MPNSGTISKFEEIRIGIRKLCTPEVADAILRQLSLTLIDKGESQEILDRYSEVLKNQTNLHEAYRFLFSSSPTNEVSKPPSLCGHDVAILSESSRAELVRIKKLLTAKLKDPVAVHEEVNRIIKICNAQPQRQHIILNLELDGLIRETSQTNIGTKIKTLKANCFNGLNSA